MVSDPVILFAVRANLVATFPAAHLLCALGISCLALDPLSFLLQSFVEDIKSNSAVLVLATPIDLDRHASFPVRENHARVCLIAMLAAGSSVSGEPHVHVFARHRNSRRLLFAHDCHCYRGSMHATAALVWRNTLPAVAAGLLTQPFKGFAFAIHD